MVKGVRHCRARRACSICGFNTHRCQNINMDYVSAVIKEESLVQIERNPCITIHRRK